MNTLLVYKVLSSLLFFIMEKAPSPVFFESTESTTSKGESVFNKIKLLRTEGQDIWMMEQSHHGRAPHKWDKIKIVVDKTVNPKTASYHQLDEKGLEIEYKTSCIRCHPGGPRAIRFKNELNFKNKLTVLKWNFLIKSYGEVVLKENNPFERKILVFEGIANNAELRVGACIVCHYKGGPRAVLTKEQVQTMKHLVKSSQMPPWPHSMTKEERAELKQFLY